MFGPSVHHHGAIAVYLIIMPQTLAAPAHSELLIKKSRFLGCVEPMADRISAQKRVAELRAQHPDAAHVCWALLAGGHSAANDDGEPSGTAGRPMLDVLRHQDLEGVLATVVRYYGGIRLGAGGLVRAYTDSVAQAMLAAEKIPLVRMIQLHGSVPYPSEGLLRRELETASATLHQVSHGERVNLLFSLPETQAESFKVRMNEACHGNVAWLEIEEYPS